MGMGYGACYASVLKKESVKKIVDFSDLEKILEKKGLTLEDCMRDFVFLETGYDEEDIDVSSEEIQLLEEKLQEFKDKTGFSLYVGHHDSEEHGSRYDGVSGPFFYLDFSDVYIKNPKLEKVGLNPELVTFVEYG